MKKVGEFFKTLIPFAIMIGEQFLALIIMLQFQMAGYIREYGFSYESMIVYLMEVYSDTNFLLRVSALFEVIAFITLSLIYFGKEKAKLATGKGSLNGRSAFYIIVLFLGVEMICGFLLMVAGILFPKLMEEYTELMEMSGLGDMSILSTILTLICAPLVEEIAMRGLTFKRAMKLFEGRFWAANFFQALLFGVLHGNIIQGTYAFVMGLVLGYVAYRYKSLWASILGHLTFNFAGTFLVAIVYGTGGVSFERYVIVLIMGIVLSCFAYTKIRE